MNPIDKHCYAMSESTEGRYRLILGFTTLEELQAAHSFVSGQRDAMERAVREYVAGFGATGLALELIRTGLTAEQYERAIEALKRGPA